MALRVKGWVTAHLEQIDATLAAAEVTMCFCGCGRLVDEARPSLYFYGQTCSVFWHLSQQHPDPEAWRANQRALDPEDRTYCGPADPVHDMPRPNPPPADEDDETAFDRLAGTAGAPRRFRRGIAPTGGAVIVDETADAATARQRGFTQRAMDAFRDFLSPPTREQVRERAQRDVVQMLQSTFQAADADTWEQLRRDEEAEQLRAGGAFTITYVGGGRLEDPMAGTTWRVDVGAQSEFVHVGPNHSHHQLVMACVERLREAQRGSLE